MHRDHAPQGSEATRPELRDSPPSLFRGRAAWTEAEVVDSSLRTPDARGYATDFATRRSLQQRPSGQDNRNDWQWTGNQAYAAPDYEARGIYSPEQRWEAPASVFRPSSSSWTPSSSLNRPIRDDPYPVRGGAASSAVAAGQDRWADNGPRFSASARGRDAPPVWAFSTAGSASDLRHGTVSSDRAGIGRQEGKAGRVALTHSPRHSQAQQKPPAPSSQQMQERQESANFEQSELEAISRLSSERVRSRDREPASGPASRTGSPLISSLLDSPNTPSEGGEGKTSRYLREIDRRNILARIDSGEKQSELAKEFRVTRAAICNLKKHRDVILSRSHANPMAKHPKRSKLKPGNLQQSQERIGITSRTASSRSSSSGSQKPIPSGPNALRKNPLVYQLSTRPTLLHFQRLSDPKADNIVFRRLCWRLMTLVTEEALAWVETTAFKRKSTKSSGMQSAKPSEASSDSYESRDACAVVIKPEAYLFQQVFRSLDPDAPMGAIHFGDFGGASTTGPLSISASMDVDVSLPPELASSHVYILHAIVPAGKSVWLAQALSALIERGAGDAFICLITLSIAAEAIGELQAAFPLLKIVTAHVDHATPDESNQMHDDYGDESNGHRRIVDRLAARIARDVDTEAANG